MKTKLIVYLLVIAPLTLLWTNCTKGNKEGNITVDDTVDVHEAARHEHASDLTVTEAGKPQFTVSEIFQKQLAAVFTAYIALKDAFVSSDADKVKEQAKETEAAVGKVDMTLVADAAHHDWMNYQKGMATSLKEIQASGDIEAQREAFSTLSDNLYKAIKAYGLAGQTAYYEFCPMAFNNKGGYWLSESQTIRNPYFGDKMLTCGSVKEKL